MVVNICNPSYMGGIGRRITIQTDPGKYKTLSENKLKQKRA
jgi:hypothetical protein